MKILNVHVLEVSKFKKVKLGRETLKRNNRLIVMPSRVL